MSRKSKAKIIIVDDDEGARASLRLLLETMEFAVEDFDSAEAHLSALPGEAPDCLILDHNLSGMSGLDLLVQLRQHGITAPTIIITGNAKDVEARARRAGVIAVLRKPDVADALARLLDQLFPGH